MLIESYVHKLKLAVDEALAARSRAVICEAKDVFFKSVHSLYSAPRIAEPVWLTMMTCSSQRSQLGAKFVNDFVSLTKKYDTKSSKFFLSCLITGVLTHHLSWASTVAPVGDTAASTYLDKHMAKWLNSLARSHSYNPLWAQLGDLYGAVGFPRCLTRTVIVGKNTQLIKQILWVLTYFIRCSELAENTEVCPSLTADVDDTTTLMSAGDVKTPVDCVSADVTLSSGDSTSTSVKSGSPVTSEKLQFVATDSSPAFVLKPVSGSNGRNIHVRFENGSTGASQCLVNSSKSEDHSFKSTVISECTSSTVVAEKSTLLSTDSLLVPRPLLGFRSDVLDYLPPLLCSECSDCKCSQPFEDCCENLTNPRSKELSPTDGDVPLVSSKSLSLPGVSDGPSDLGGTTTVLTHGENIPSSDLPKLCQLSPVEANENVRVERIPHVGRECVEESQPVLCRVPLEKQAISLPDLCNSITKSPDKGQFPLKLFQVPQYVHSISMFDEYFDDSSSCPVIDLCGTDDKAAFTRCVDDTSTFDEIMNEPCPDVSHIDISRHSSGSSSSEMIPDALSVPPITVPPSSRLPETVANSTAAPTTFSNAFDDTHFATEKNEEHLDDIPDGPSKQMISSHIKLMQDVCSDRTSLSGVDDLADVPASEYFSQTGLARGRQRHPSGQSNTSARCRSTTPSDSVTCRQTSTSSCDAHPLCAYDCLMELPVPKGRESLEEGTLSQDSNLGRSLLAGYCERYQPDFVLHGTSDRSFLDKQLQPDLQLTLKNSVLDEPIAEASCIVADVDDWSVKLYSCTYNDAERLRKQPLMSSSKLVCNLIESVQEFWSFKVSAEYCLMHLEDQLQSIYLKSKLLAEYIKVHRRVFSHELASLHEYDASDIALLLAVAGTHSPDLLLSLTENQLKCPAAL